MDDQAILRAIEHWHLTGDEQALSECLGWLERWLPIPQGVVRALGHAEVENIRVEVLEYLLIGEPPPLLRARQPRAFARVTFKSRLWDALRRLKQRSVTRRPEIATTLAERTHAHPSPDLDAQLDEAQQLQRILDVLRGLRLEERAALLLLHAPDRLSHEDWEALARRHPPPPPTRPTDILERKAIARLVFPSEKAAYDRTNKLIDRAYPKLRRALGIPAESPEET
ncbi:hypothetical protein [Archangium sp.]|uniref:hypothetical protein n=1 Tax=Archangium sp. TaxID=1872627 RepID=UPI00389A7307